MRVEIDDCKYGSAIRLHPDTVSDITGLIRTCKNAKKGSLRLIVSFNEDGTVLATITVDKRLPNSQINYITT